MFFPSTIHESAKTDLSVERPVANERLMPEVVGEPLDNFSLGLTFFETQAYDRAAEALRQVPPNPPARFAWAQEWLGQAYMKLQRDELAIEALQRAVQLHEYLKRDPLTIAECQFSLGLAFARSGYHEMALAEFRKALKQAPDWSTIHFEEARVHAHRNRTIECLGALGRAIHEDHIFLQKANRDPDFAQVCQSPQFLRLWLEKLSES